MVVPKVKPTRARYYIGTITTVEPTSKGHIGVSHFAPYREAVLISKVYYVLIHC